MPKKKPAIVDELSTGSGLPKYLKLYEYLESEIKAGRWAPGDSLPTEQDLTKQMKISRNTVRQAFAQLEKQKIIIRIKGKGTFVANQNAVPREIRTEALSSAALSSIFAFISPQLRTTIISSAISGFQDECARQYYDMLLGKTGNDIGQQADIIIQMLERKVGGIALIPTTIPTPAHQLRLIRNHQVPLVLCHRTVPGISAPSVVFSGYDVGYKLGESLISQGHRRVGFLFFYSYPLIEEYQKGLRDALTQNGIDPSGLLTHEYGPGISMPTSVLDQQTKTDEQAQTNEQAIQKGLHELLALPDPPTVIFCSNSELAEVVYLQLESMGLKIPEDISLVVLRSTCQTGGFASRLSGIGLPEHEIGTRAGRLLHEMHTGQRPLDDNEQIVLPVSILEGRTLGPVKRRSLVGIK